MKDSKILVNVWASYDYAENYAAHNWDGEGECPQHWKQKGADDVLLFSGVELDIATHPDFEEWADSLGMEQSYSSEYASYYFMGCYIKPVNMMDRHEQFDAEWANDHEYLALFETMESLHVPDEDAPLDRFDALAEELGFLNA